MTNFNFDQLTDPANTERDWNETNSRILRGNPRLYSFLPRIVLILFTILTLSVGQMWAAETQTKTNTKQKFTKADTAYIITPTISTQDTIYLKHEDTSSKETWWQRNGGSLIEALAVLLLGAGISMFTTYLNARSESKRKKQEKILDESIEIEKNIYNQFIAIRNEQDNARREELLDKIEIQIQQAELTMRTPLQLAANNLLNFYSQGGGNEIDAIVEEKRLLEEYKHLFFMQD